MRMDFEKICKNIGIRVVKIGDRDGLRGHYQLSIPGADESIKVWVAYHCEPFGSSLTNIQNILCKAYITWLERCDIKSYEVYEKLCTLYGMMMWEIDWQEGHLDN